MTILTSGTRSNSPSRIVILQSNYIPWRGYFALLANADALVILDSAKYTKNDWRNRNKLRGADGSFWLTIPISRESTNGRIYDASVSDVRWVDRHLVSIRQALSGMKHSPQVVDVLAADYQSFANERLLHNINMRLIRTICRAASISTQIFLDTQVIDAELLSPGTDPTLRLINICKALNATTYLTGSRALAYLDLNQFRNSSITVEVADYSQLSVYRQKYEGFDQGVSILDYLAAVGLDQASEYLNSVALPSDVVT
jgi:hypothetical protein